MAEFGEILHIIGDFGSFQKIILAALCLPNIIMAFLFANVYFTESDPERHCNTNWILKVNPNLTTEEQLNLTVPLEDDGSFSKCQMFVPVDWDIDAIREFGLNETTGCRDGWKYNSVLYESTIVTDFNLVCDKQNMVQVAQTVFMAGILVGCLLFGPFAESFGRKRAVQMPIFLTVIFILTTALSPNFYLYLASQFMVGIGYGGFRLNCVILATEWIGMSKRSWGACLTQLCGAIGNSVLAGLIYLVRNWRVTQFITAALLGVVALYIWFIPESARWLLDMGKPEEAKELIKKVAAINGRKVPESLLDRIVVKEKEEKMGIIILIQSSILRKYFLALILGWFSLNLTYFCLSLNVGKFGLDIFLTQAVFGLSEVPAHLLCIWLLELSGRKVSLMSTLMAAGVLCLLLLAFPEGNAVAVTILATVGRIFSNWAGSVCSVYVQELFPTSFRQTASGLGSIVSRAGGLLAPLLNMLEMYHWSIPTIVFGTLTFVSGGLGFLLPETKRKELPDTTDEAEDNRNKMPMKTKKTHKESDVHPQDKSTKL